MTTADRIDALKARFGSAITAAEPTALDPFVVVDAAAWPDIARALHDDHGYDMLNDLGGVDYLETDPKKIAKAGFEPHLEVVYHLSAFTRPGDRVTVKVMLPRGGEGEWPQIPSVAAIWKAADWHEREAYDLFGIRFTGHPDLRRILMNDDWVGHPLRKDYEFPLEYHDIRCR
jgi:NADH-quinone oxidoreductase subunit C